MSSRPKNTIWPADQHTVAKIEIVKRYLYRWAMITGTTFAGKPLTYIDGFAGPGSYTNHEEGSPIAAMKALNDAKDHSADRWKATKIRALFVEQDPARKAHLDNLIIERKAAGAVEWISRECTFVEGLAFAEGSFAKAFFTSAPLVVFIDPFGATGFPWSAVVKILGSKTSEIILNFDADGMARIIKAGENANASEILTTIFGGDEWILAIAGLTASRDIGHALLALYKSKLKKIPNVKYTFAFEMASGTTSIDYFLLFASQHSKGLEKMKEAMKDLDQTGNFRFSDAEATQDRLFKFDEPSDWVSKLCEEFAGKSVAYTEVLDFVLNETPFINPSKLLYSTQELGLLTVDCNPPRKKKNSFKADEVKFIHFKEN